MVRTGNQGHGREGKRRGGFIRPFAELITLNNVLSTAQLEIKHEPEKKRERTDEALGVGLWGREGSIEISRKSKGEIKIPNPLPLLPQS